VVDVKLQLEKIFGRIWIGILVSLIILFGLLIVPFIIDDGPTYSRDIATKKQIAATMIVLTNYYSEVGHYPTTSQGLIALLKKPNGPDGEKWGGPYTSARNKPTDGWNHELHYRCPGIHNPDMYDLWSYGADNKPGGEKYNADIGNWSDVEARTEDNNGYKTKKQ
jgi:general secretion pathway protein G